MTARTTIECHPSGTFFDFANPQPDAVHIEDIARALSLTNRFGGHTRWPYSVAQHALLVARLVREAGGSPELCFAALHHDSHEAYVGDIPTPLKALLGVKYSDLAESVDEAIELAFAGLSTNCFHHPIIKEADQQALFIEAAVLKVSQGVGQDWGHTRNCPVDVPTGAVTRIEPEWAEHLFLAAHRTALLNLGVVA